MKRRGALNSYEDQTVGEFIEMLIEKGERVGPGAEKSQLLWEQLLKSCYLDEYVEPKKKGLSEEAKAVLSLLALK